MASASPAAQPSAPAGMAAIDAFLLDYEARHHLRGLTPNERRIVREALVAFVTREHWLAADPDHGALLATIRSHAERAVRRGATDVAELLTAVAQLIEELATRLMLQRHSREIMQEGLVLHGEALKQARLQLPPAPPERFPPARAVDEPADPTSAAPPTPEPSADPGAGEPARYRVKFWRSAVTADRMSIEVVAGSAAAARARVLAWGRGLGELTPHEERSETIERKELQDSAFDGLLDPDDPYAVTLLGPTAPR